MTTRGCVLVAGVLLGVAGCGASAPDVLTLADLEATKVVDIAMPAPDLVTAGQPTPEQFEQLAKLGVRRMICLRPATEPGSGWEERKASELGVTFVRLPIAGSDDVTVDNAKQLAAVMARLAGAVTMVCCANSNRVGALIALKAFHVDGKTAAEALAIGKACGLRGLERRVMQQLQ